MRRSLKRGFTSAELLLVLALGALVIGGAVVSFGTLVRNQPRLSSVVEVDLGARMSAWFGAGIGTTKLNVNTAPNFGAVAMAERLRDQFNYDVVGATTVFCLSRDSAQPNTFHPTTITYNPATDAILDTSQAFRSHLLAKGLIASSLFGTDRNYSASKPNASIFILGYSKTSGQLSVIAVYDIDVLKSVNPNGFYAAVRRYVGPPVVGVNEPMGYEVFFQPYTELYNSSTWPNANGTTDGFTPLFVSFERSARAALTEGTSIDRFKKAAERPFHLIWWPDPGASDLRRQPNSMPTTDPRAAYNQQGGRTSFMFTVPIFPSL